MTLTQSKIPKNKFSKKCQKEFAVVQKALTQKSPTLWNGNITRMGFVSTPPKKSDKIITKLTIPIGSAKYFDHLKTVYCPSAGLQKWLDDKEQQKILLSDASSKNYYDKMHAALTFDIGMNAVLEIGKDARGNPTHILLLKRPPTVPAEPNVYDFPASFIRPHQNPMASLLKRMHEEVGVSRKNISIIGMDLKPVRNKVVFALHRMDRLTDYNAFIILRTPLPASRIRQLAHDALEKGLRDKDPWSPVEFKLINRNPKDIRQFIEKNPTVFPEILLEYADELAQSLGQK